MDNTIIRLWFDPFNSEYHADIAIFNNSEYLASDNLTTLMDEVKKVILKWNKEE